MRRAAGMDPLVMQWMERMRAGDFAGAWRVSDQVLGQGPPVYGAEVPLHLRRIWDGTPLARRTVRVQRTRLGGHAAPPSGRASASWPR